MTSQTFPIGSHVVKMGWDNRPLEAGLVVGREEPSTASVLFPSGVRSVYDHDLLPASRVTPPKNERRPAGKPDKNSPKYAQPIPTNEETTLDPLLLLPPAEERSEPTHPKDKTIPTNEETTLP